MVKLTYVFSRSEGKTLGEFRTWLLKTHAPIVAQLPGLRGYVVNFATSGMEGEAQCDAVADLVFDDPAAMEAAFASQTAQVMAADSAPWVGKAFAVLVEEHVVVRLPAVVA